MKDVARPDVKPAFAERNVPVALATDENYLLYLKVTINSAIASSPGSNLDIIVLHAGIPEDAILDFTAGYAGVGNASVRFVDISGELETSGLSDYRQTARLPLSSCYRLLLPRILPAYGKIVYIDVDVAVCRDLGELYETDVGDNWFAAAKDVVYNTKPEYVFWAAKWGFAEWDGYVNAGVLVMNLERFRREPVFDRLKEIVFEAAKWNCDQDALNFVCKGAIALLDPRWNVQLGDYCLKKQLDLTGDEMWVAHFTGGQKPWAFPARRYSHLWWRHVCDDGVELWRKNMGLSESGRVCGKICLSVIIPVFNAEPYLWECLMSVLGRSEPSDMEVVCVDDGSADRSRDILQTIKRLDFRVKLIEQPNQGPGVARNSGLKEARGDYVIFLDSDDRLYSGVNLKELLERMRTDKLDILICGSNRIDRNGLILGKFCLNETLIPSEAVFGPEVLGANLYRLTPQNPWSKVYRREFLLGNQLTFPSLKRSEDFAFVQLAYALAERLGVMKSPLVDHRIGVPTSCESTKDETPLIFFEGEKIFLDSLKQHDIEKRFRTAASISSVLRLAYNLGAVKSFSSFVAIARRAKVVYGSLKESLRGAIPPDVAKALSFVEEVISGTNSEPHLVDLFIKIRSAKMVERNEFDVVCEEMRLQEAELAESKKRRSEIWAEREKMKEAVAKARQELAESKKRRGEIWAEREKMKEAVAKARQELAESKKRRVEIWAGREKMKDEMLKARAERDSMKEELTKVRTELAESKKRRGEIWAEREKMKDEMLKARARLQEERAFSLAEHNALQCQLSRLSDALTQISSLVDQ